MPSSEVHALATVWMLLSLWDFRIHELNKKLVTILTKRDECPDVQSKSQILSE